ncbi:hypothetical protein [Rosistilla oblonga]|uniref:hypothetical protein n=1 Tax=Rosistilla oblonga TaxID=2527990 RepID=UPI003A976FC3
MNIELSEQTEKVARTIVESGRFTTVEAFLEAAAQAFMAQSCVPLPADKPTADQLKERFRPFRGKLKMSREEVVGPVIRSV